MSDMTPEQRRAGWLPQLTTADARAAIASGVACAGCGQRWADGEQQVSMPLGPMHPACAKAKGYEVTVPKRHATPTIKELFG